MFPRDWRRDGGKVIPVIKSDVHKSTLIIGIM